MSNSRIASILYTIRHPDIRLCLSISPAEKAIRVEVVVDPARAAAQAAQVAAVTAPIAARGGRGGAAAARGGRGAAKAGRGGRGGATTGGKAAQRPKKSAEDLDAEMEEYSANKSNEVV